MQDPVLMASYSNFLELSGSPDPLYQLHWNVTGHRINFAVRVETSGWVGFGISPTGLMLDSDVVMGFVDNNTQVATLQVSMLFACDNIYTVRY